MATGTTNRNDMLHRDPFIQSGYVETLTQALNKFNGESNGAISLRTERKIGDFSYEAFFKNAGGMVSRQDQSSMNAAPSIKLAQDQIVSVKLNRKIGPTEWNRAAFLKPGFSADAFKVVAGTQAAKDVLGDMLNTGLVAGRSAILSVPDLVANLGAGTLDASGLATGLSKFGDQASRIVAFVMHSKVFYDLVKTQINPASNGYTISGAVVQGASPASFGRPIIVSDSDSLFDGTHYTTLGLTADGIVVEETEDMYSTLQEVTGLEQILMRMQGEYAYNLGVKGFAWDVANGGKNPDAAAVAAAANWDRKYSSHKDLAGFAIVSA
jgi:hypothetical protein